MKAYISLQEFEVWFKPGRIRDKPQVDPKSIAIYLEDRKETINPPDWLADIIASALEDDIPEDIVSAAVEEERTIGISDHGQDN